VAGKRNSGNLGDNVPVGSGERNEPFTLPDLAGIAAVAAGNLHSLALTETGELWAWGSNTSYQLGLLTDLVNQYKPVAVPFPRPLRAVAAGSNVSAAIDTDGGLWLWGNDPTRELPPPGPYPMGLAPATVAGLPAIGAVSVGRDVILLAGEDGSLWEIGKRPREGVARPVQLELPAEATEAKVIDVAAGHGLMTFHGLAALDDGRVLGWGSSSNGVLGEDITETVSRPTLLSGFEDHLIASVHAGPTVSAFVTVAGELLLIGRGGDGLLGRGSTTSSGVPKTVLEGVDSFALGVGPFAVADVGSQFYAWGAQHPALGLGELTDRVTTPTKRD